ncbi:MAG: DUF3857 domain-containing protein [Bacteroidia bacterium]|nr:DUF3857 domain-containing protein [Bacteroidia bacterium]
MYFKFLLRCATGLACALALAPTLVAQKSGGGEYAAVLIPDSLKSGSVAVYRKNNYTYSIADDGTYQLEREFVVTVLEPEGAHFANLEVVYDTYQQISQVGIRTYDSLGVADEKVARGNILDVAYYTSATDFIKGARIKYFKTEYPTYPYTVEIKYTEKVATGFLAKPYFPFPGEKVSLQSSVCKVSYPRGAGFRYKAYGEFAEPTQTQTEDRVELLWTLQGRRPVLYEPFTLAPWPHVRFAIDEFSFEGYRGSQKSWADFGRWIWDITKDRLTLTPNETIRAQSIASQYITVPEKVSALYQAMQTDCRYVYVGYGIGGFQPLEASYVSQNRFGDCKALTNYLQALCLAVGIEAYSCVIHAGDDDFVIDTSFVATQFNHVVLCVPNGGDTLWFENTSKDLPPGYLGSFTENRYGVLCTPNGGKLVRTPVTSADRNQDLLKVRVQLSVNGDAEVETRLQSRGYTYTDYLMQLAQANTQERDKFLADFLGDLPNYTLKDFDASKIKTRQLEGALTLRLATQGLANKAANRLVLKPNVVNRRTYLPEELPQRKTDFHFQHPLTEIDTVQIVLPDEFYLKSAPAPLVIEADFAQYEASFHYQTDTRTLTYVRRLVWKKSVHPAAEWASFRTFYKQVIDADNTKVVLMPAT